MMHLNNELKPYGERFPSKISIYNYPEHLNPFNEEDNHKRLRFWKFSKSNDNSKRRSFSFGNIRDVWSFRSFNFKKKSSTLGIQKTSESPPVLRRNLDSITPYLNSGGNNANKRRPVMRSLQNVSSIDMTMGQRSDGPPYHGNAYFDRCSMPKSQTYQTMRSSISSLSSTNPFESEIESDINYDVNNIVGSSPRLRTKTYRKKRKAPSAPTKTMITKPQNILVQENSIDSRTNNMEDLDIMSLTCEIERFVSHSNETSDNQELPTLEASKDSEIQPTTVLFTETAYRITPSQDRVSIAHNEDTIKMAAPNRKYLSNKASLSTRSNISSQEHISNAKEQLLKQSNVSGKSHSSIDESLLEVDKSITELFTEEKNVDKIIDEDSLSNKERLTIKHILDTGEYNSKESCRSTNELKVIEVNETPNITTQEHSVESIKENSIEFSGPRKERSKVYACESLSNNTPILLNLKTKEKNSIQFAELTTEQTEASLLRRDKNNYNICREGQLKTKEDNASQIRENSKSYETINNEVQFKDTIQSLPIIKGSNCISLVEKICKNNNNIPNLEYFSNPLTIFEGSERIIDSQNAAKTSKVKSVKEIIDSINRSQRLLKESAAKGTVKYSTALYSTKNISSNNNHNTSEVIQNDISAGSSSLENHLDLKQDFQKNKIDKVVFQCRESSPTSSNLDWNPVPKPKRINSNSINKGINEL